VGAGMNTRTPRKNDLLEAIAAYELWSFLAWQDIRIKYRRSKIGPMWITISMAVFCIALGIVYSQLFKTEIRELLPFLAIGLVVWGFLSSCLGEMPNLFVDNAPYIRDMRINPLTIIFRALARNAIVFGHNLLIVLGIYLVFGMWPGWVGLLALPGFLLVVLNMLAIAVPLSIVGARFRDLSQITQSILQVVFFITPIFWFPRLLEKGSWIIAINPAAYFIDLVRSPLLGHPPALLSWGVSLLTLLLCSLIAASVYRSKSKMVAFWV
jgi:ABC-type polysaccharide/polyol phosphate export permease